MLVSNWKSKKNGLLVTGKVTKCLLVTGKVKKMLVSNWKSKKMAC